MGVCVCLLMGGGGGVGWRDMALGMIFACFAVIEGGVLLMRYVTKGACHLKSLRGVTQGGVGVKMTIFSVTYLLDAPKAENGNT